MVEGRSKQAFKTWLAARPKLWRDRVEVVAMDGFTGFKTATSEELPEAVAVMDPFHVVRLAGDALDQCRRRVQQDTCGHRGRSGDPLYGARRTLHTGADLLTDKQTTRLDELFANDAHVQVEASWRIYQQMIAAYRQPDRALGHRMMNTLIQALSAGIPAALTELITLGRTLKRRGCRRARLLHPARHQQRPDRSHQRPTRAPPRHRPRVPQPDQLCRQITPRDRRIQTPTTPWIVKSRQSLGCQDALSVAVIDAVSSADVPVDPDVGGDVVRPEPVQASLAFWEARGAVSRSIWSVSFRERPGARSGLRSLSRRSLCKHRS